jgi:CDP-diglyceride synthetase
LPIFLIIIADVSSCTIGFLFGRKLILRFGNKKSLEGIIGGSLFTFIFAFIVKYIDNSKIKFKIKNKK